MSKIAQPVPHAMTLAVETADFEREMFCRDLNLFLETKLRPRLKTIYETRVHPDLVAALGREPDRREIARAMREVDVTKLWYAMRTSSQRAMYDVTTSIIEGQMAALQDRAAAVSDRAGTLELDPDLKIPRYIEALDVHNLPGGYTRETEGDLAAGAVYDRNMTCNRMGMQGPLTDDSGRTLSAWVKARFPDLKPKRILEMGCTVGHTLLPFKETFPDADVIGIDVAAPCLRYGHARAQALDVDVHFSQQNAEHTRFESGSFDLVYSYILMHETSRAAVPRILAECHRLLRPGGVMIHADAPQFDELDPYTQSLRDWDVTCNFEPFMETYYSLPIETLYEEAGFARADTFREYAMSEHVSRNGVDPAITRNGGRFFMVGAVKS